MLTSIQRTLSFTRAWLRPPRDVIEEEVTVDRDGTAVRATLVRPSITASELPAWVVMHGITRPGRSHTQLVRFTRALARAGIAAIVPDVPEWRDLQLRPDLSVPSIAASVRWLRDSELIRDEPVGVVGFSFGAPHAVGARASPRLRDEIGAACGFGGWTLQSPSGKYRRRDGASERVPWLLPPSTAALVALARRLCQPRHHRRRVGRVAAPPPAASAPRPLGPLALKEASSASVEKSVSSAGSAAAAALRHTVSARARAGTRFQ